MRRIQFVSDRLVEQIIEGVKTASVVSLDEVDKDEDEFNHALVCGQEYQVFSLTREHRCNIRIVGMELCRWNHIPERLWRGEANDSAEEFKSDHVDYFDDPSDEFEFIAYYFKLVDGSVQSMKPK